MTQQKFRARKKTENKRAVACQSVEYFARPPIRLLKLLISPPYDKTALVFPKKYCGYADELTRAHKKCMNEMEKKLADDLGIE